MNSTICELLVQVASRPLAPPFLQSQRTKNKAQSGYVGDNGVCNLYVSSQRPLDVRYSNELRVEAPPGPPAPADSRSLPATCVYVASKKATEDNRAGTQMPHAEARQYHGVYRAQLKL